MTRMKRWAVDAMQAALEIGRSRVPQQHAKQAAPEPHYGQAHAHLKQAEQLILGVKALLQLDEPEAPRQAQPKQAAPEYWLDEFEALGQAHADLEQAAATEWAALQQRAEVLQAQNEQLQAQNEQLQAQAERQLLETEACQRARAATVTRLRNAPQRQGGGRVPG